MRSSEILSCHFCPKNSSDIDRGRMSFSGCRPIKSVDELKALVLNPKSRSQVPLAQDLMMNRKEKVLMCHDMAGGYKKDAITDGSDGVDVYHSQYLHFVDIFCYFSHERVTIPPKQWVDVCHRVGVPCLGTIIVEWEKGEQEILNLIYGPDYDALLESTKRDFSPFFADRLVEVAEFYGFEGYLFNVESRLPSATHCIVLQRFIKYLTFRLHATIPSSKLFWYDSVLYNGDLRWQDQLNPKNEMFFDVCDGIFTNYTWKVERLEKSAHNGEVKQRKKDIFTGIDVWGRNTFGGGGFNCHKALREIAKVGTSVALFAPAWTFERLGATSFQQSEKRFWLYPTIRGFQADESLFTIDKDDLGSIATYLPPRVICGSFQTNFCQGIGQLMARKGIIETKRPWNNLSLQNLQPTITELFIPSPLPALSLYCSVSNSDAFDGGNCLELAADSTTPFGCFLFATSFTCSVKCELVFKISDNSLNHVGILYEEEQEARKSKKCCFIQKIEEVGNGWVKGNVTLDAPCTGEGKIVKVGIIISESSSLRGPLDDWKEGTAAKDNDSHSLDLPMCIKVGLFEIQVAPKPSTRVFD